MRFAGMALALCLLLAGCGGSDAATAKKTATSKTTATKAAPSSKPTQTQPTQTQPTEVKPTGIPAPADLTDFQCLADSKGDWNASGILTNASKKRMTYQVTVYVGEANGKDSKALTKQYAMINSEGSIKVSMTKIPAADDASQCFVQVLASPSGA